MLINVGIISTIIYLIDLDMITYIQYTIITQTAKCQDNTIYTYIISSLITLVKCLEKF